jgi:hypothetical protein
MSRYLGHIDMSINKIRQEESDTNRPPYHHHITAKARKGDPTHHYNSDSRGLTKT